MSHDCLQSEEGLVPCLRHLLELDAPKCYIIFCYDCGKDIRRECEGE